MKKQVPVEVSDLIESKHLDYRKDEASCGIILFTYMRYVEEGSKCFWTLATFASA